MPTSARARDDYNYAAQLTPFPSQAVPDLYSQLDPAATKGSYNKAL
jgi:hypothetical protein